MSLRRAVEEDILHAQPANGLDAREMLSVQVHPSDIQTEHPPQGLYWQIERIEDDRVFSSCEEFLMLRIVGCGDVISVSVLL